MKIDVKSIRTDTIADNNLGYAYIYIDKLMGLKHVLAIISHVCDIIVVLKPLVSHCEIYLKPTSPYLNRTYILCIFESAMY